MKKGFTLVEYIIAMALIGVLTATFVYSASNFFPSFRLRGAGNNLTSNLRQAQEEAVTSQVRHALRFNNQTNPTSYQIIKIETDPNTGVDTETVVKGVNFPSGLTVILDSTITGGQIIFSADGGPGSYGNVNLNIGSLSRQVNISAAGVIKMQ